jgi:hypothetical protein
MDYSGITRLGEAASGGAGLAALQVALCLARAAVRGVDHQIDLAAVLDPVIAVGEAGRARVRAAAEDT